MGRLCFAVPTDVEDECLVSDVLRELRDGFNDRQGNEQLPSVTEERKYGRVDTAQGVNDVACPTS